MIRIEEIVAEQRSKVENVLCGGKIYGKDYNRVKAILEHHRDKVLVRDIVETIEDETLKKKVETWMANITIKAAG